MEILLLEHKPEISKDERNLQILNLYREEHLSYQEIGDIVNLSKVHVGRILKEVFAVTPRNKSWEKEKRIHATWREFKNKENEPSKKDKIDILEQLRKEFEGEEKNPQVIINKVEVLIEYGTANIQNQEKRNDGQGNFIDIEASQMLGK